MYNFVINYSDSEISEFTQIKDLSDIAENTPKLAAKIFSKGDLAWCLQTFLNLSKTTSLPFKCSNKLSDNCINIIHSDTVLNLEGNSSQFIVCVQADYPRRCWSHYHIVQNKNQVLSDTSYIPHWVQPGLIKRNPDRHEVKRVAYSGQTFNKNLAGSEETWKKMLEPHGIEFITLSNNSWHDLSNIDVLIGIRSFDTNPWNNKPPSKLFNAWHAEIPFIGGHDSAFKQVGTPEQDYLLVKTQEEAVAAILNLQSDNDLYQRIVNNGKKKALSYTAETITKIWEDVLGKEIMNRYELWKNRQKYETLRFSIVRRYGLFEHRSKQIIKKLMP
ncbi:MAG: hypothetical protein H7Y07_12480 [Pyrinomonadaceae bacterium]|nr:hypothetical protein [Sphingobacteriaceae bacterium]